jgi:tRNA threonylcarbamoyladenosine biosynthesis protein TsaB
MPCARRLGQSRGIACAAGLDVFMLILAIDTALAACATAVLDTVTGELLATETLAMARGHAEALMPQIARVMDAAHREFADLDRITVTVGPGSFTGLRVGISAARGLALAAGKPAIGLSTLSALAAPHVAARMQDTIIAAIDARNDQVYFQIFAANGTTVVAPRLDLAGNAARATVMEPTVITGSGAALMAAQWPSGGPAPRIDMHDAPDIGWVARLGAAARDDRSAPKPLYLRRPDARPQDAGRLPRR